MGDSIRVVNRTQKIIVNPSINLSEPGPNGPIILKSAIRPVSVVNAGPVGPAGADGADDKNYIHSQAIPSASWVIDHELDKYASVSIVDSAGTTVSGEVDYISSDSIVVSFSGAFSGKAFIN